MLPPDAYADYAKSLQRPTSLPLRERPALHPFVAYDLAFSRTIWGVVFVGIELATATIMTGLGFFGSPLQYSGGLFAGLGLVCLLTSAHIFSPVHRRLVLVSTILLVAVLAAAIAVALAVPRFLVPAGVFGEGYYRADILAYTILVPIGLAGLALASWGIQDRTGRYLLILGIVTAVVVQILLWFLLNDALDAAVASPLSSPVWAFPATWGRLGALNAIPAGILTAAYERLYWRLHRQHLAMLPRAPA